MFQDVRAEIPWATHAIIYANAVTRGFHDASYNMPADEKFDFTKSTWGFNWSCILSWKAEIDLWWKHRNEIIVQMRNAEMFQDTAYAPSTASLGNKDGRSRHQPYVVPRRQELWVGGPRSDLEYATVSFRQVEYCNDHLEYAGENPHHHAKHDLRSFKVPEDVPILYFIVPK